MARADSSFRRSSGLPAYRVRLSDRARRLQLKVSPLGQVEVVVPRGTDPEVASTFVGRHRQWLERTLARLGRNTDDPELTAPLPTRIDLRALGTRRAVLYETAAGGGAPAVSA
ncbi:MAG: M48 family metallopeptidase, partial [Gammaproteobacteria bacterium]|nr:M48 family metallopeptidase [Gammaproteobacteria bacterium]